jgi:YegS/Rv2252/BmrU family lipid kinase
MLKTVIILNPAARGERAAGLVRKIEELAAPSALVRMTSGPGEALGIAEWAISQGYEQVVAAGGDGTINEVVNGIAGSPAALGILPVGSMNVFAAELGLPKGLKECWQVVQEGATRQIDLPEANGHVFVQLAGVGLDAQVVQATSWDFKRDFGPLSYLISAAQIAAGKPPRLAVDANGRAFEGSFVLIGNGRFYGGPFPMFPSAQIDDGLLDILIFKNLGYLDLVRYLHGLLFGTHVDFDDVEYFRAPRLSVSSGSQVPVEVDGEVIGELPVHFGFRPERLRVLAPKGKPKS